MGVLLVLPQNNPLPAQQHRESSARAIPAGNLSLPPRILQDVPSSSAYSHTSPHTSPPLPPSSSLAVVPERDYPYVGMTNVCNWNRINGARVTHKTNNPPVGYYEIPPRVSSV